MKKLILVEIDVKDSDPKKCGKHCSGLAWNDEVNREFCEIFFIESLEMSHRWPMRCGECLDAEKQFDEVSAELRRLTEERGDDGYFCESEEAND